MSFIVLLVGFNDRALGQHLISFFVRVWFSLVTVDAIERFLFRVWLSAVSVAAMEDLELVDYSSDHLEAQDVWGVPAGGLMEGLEDFPRLGPEGTGKTGGGQERPVFGLFAIRFSLFFTTMSFSRVY